MVLAAEGDWLLFLITLHAPLSTVLNRTLEGALSRLLPATAPDGSPHSSSITPEVKCITKKESQKRLSFRITSGRYLLSHAVAHILPSARGGLTAGFGMEPGVSRPGIFTQNNCSLKSA